MLLIFLFFLSPALPFQNDVQQKATRRGVHGAEETLACLHEPPGDDVAAPLRRCILSGVGAHSLSAHALSACLTPRSPIAPSKERT